MPNFFRKVNFNQIFWFLFYFFIFCLLLHNSYNYLDPDFGWHLQVGHEISLSRQVPNWNHYNYASPGTWVDHEWLSNLLLYLGFEQGGYLSISIFFALLVVIVLWLLERWARRIWPDIPTGLLVFLSALGIVASLPHFGIRLQELNLLFLLVSFLIIDRYDRSKDWHILLFFPPLFYFWACLHAGFLIGLFVLASWLAVKIGQRLLARFWPRPEIDLSNLLQRKDALIFSGVAAISCLVTMATPYRLQLYSFLSGYGSTFYQSHIQEWLPQSAFPFYYWQLFYLSLVIGLSGLYIYEAFTQRRPVKLDLWQLFLTVVFVALSFKSRRHFPLMFVATFIWLTQAWRHTFGSLTKKPGGKGINRWLGLYLLFCLLIVSACQLIQTRFTPDPSQAFCDDYPCGAVRFLRANQDLRQARMFNDYGWGGYLIWQLPDWPIFIDGRLPQTALAGHTYLEEYYEFSKTDEGIARKLDQYDIRLALIPARIKAIEAKNWEKFLFGIRDEELKPNTNLRDYFYKTKSWRLIYNDRSALLFKRFD
jgi:hypothetical protein